MPDELTLLVTIVNESAVATDTVAANIADGLTAAHPSVNKPKLSGNGWSITVASIKRADGQPLGVESEFEQFWAEMHGEGEETDPYQESIARDAFLYGVKIGQKKL